MSGSFAKGSQGVTEVVEASSFWIDRESLCLWRSHAGGEDERVRLTPKSFDVLRYLAENPGRLVTHDELLEALWPGVHVQPEVLKSHILSIRTALGDTISSPRFIETQRGRGYRFIGTLRGSPSTAGKPGPAVDLGVFAGRAEPLRSLLALLERAAAGEPQAAFISGEPGIGKTTLVQQFLARASTYADPVVAQGHCVENFAGAEPYYPIFEALGELCKDAGTGAVRALEALAPSWAAQMPAQFSAAQRMALQQQAMPGAPSRMVREACSLFEALATERPLILVLEDLHWADFATIDLISALCRRRSSAKLLLIATYRPEDLTAAQRPLRQMTQDLALRKILQRDRARPSVGDRDHRDLVGRHSRVRRILRSSPNSSRSAPAAIRCSCGSRWSICFSVGTSSGRPRLAAPRALSASWRPRRPRRSGARSRRSSRG